MTSSTHPESINDSSNAVIAEVKQLSIMNITDAIKNSTVNRVITPSYS